MLSGTSDEQVQENGDGEPGFYARSRSRITWIRLPRATIST